MKNFSKEEQQHRDYISLLEELLEAGDETGELHLEGKLLHDSVKKINCLEIFIGTKRLYKVMSLRSLMEKYDRKRKICVRHDGPVYGKNAFDEDSGKLWQFLRDMWLDRMGRGKLAQRGRQTDEWQLNLVLLRRFFQCMGEREFSLLLDGKERQIRLRRGNPEVVLEVQENNGTGLLCMQSELILLVRDGSYVLQGDVIWCTGRNFQGSFPTVYRRLQADGQFIIPNDDMPSFLRCMMPRLEQVADVRVDQRFQNYFSAEPLKAELYLDAYHRGLSIRVSFSYGNIHFDPMKDNPLTDFGGAGDSRLLIRDKTAEKRILDALLQHGFTRKSQGLVQADEESCYLFLQKTLPELSRLAAVYYADEFKDGLVKSMPVLRLGVSVGRENMLRVSLQTPELDVQEMLDILEACRLKRSYYRLRTGQFLFLENKELQSLADFFHNIEGAAVRQADQLVLPMSQAVLLDGLCQDIQNETAMFSVDFDASSRKLLHAIWNPQECAGEIPEVFKKLLRSYQKSGVQWLNNLSFCGLGGILADDMGLGKTLETIVFLAMQGSRKRKPSLIVVPAAVLYNWEAEFQRFAPWMHIAVVQGKPQERRALLEVSGYEVLLTTYSLLQRDLAYYLQCEFQCVFLDEAQHIKNPLTKSAKAAKSLRSVCRFALTGTPVENNLMELWSVFDFILPGYLMQYERFKTVFEVPIVQENNRAMAEELKHRIRPFLLRRMKAAVLKELPEKLEQPWLCDMSARQKKLYAAYLAQGRKEFRQLMAESDGGQKSMTIFALLTRLRQIACDPGMFLDDYEGRSGKLEALLEIVPAAIEGGHRILIFSQFVVMLQRIAGQLTKADIAYLSLDGSTPSRERLRLCQQFNHGDCPVFLISLKAGGTGMNLTGADMVIHFDPWWNPAVEDQASDRAYRMGQTRMVQVLRLIARGTVEEKIYRLQEAKRVLIDDMIEPGEHFLTKLSRKEIFELFEPL